jgi:hypothetical protein
MVEDGPLMDGDDIRHEEPRGETHDMLGLFA